MKNRGVDVPKLDLSEYNYNLPPERIAQYPASERDKSKLLVYREGKIISDFFNNIYRYLPADSLLVFNNARVINARLIFRKKTGALVEIFCLEPVSPADYESSFGALAPVEWKCIIGNLKRWKTGELEMPFTHQGKEYTLFAEKTEMAGEAWKIRFRWNCEGLSFGDVIEIAGRIPLPPYIKRNSEINDNLWYQTVYSRIKGSVAAPTAGLHFTENVIKKLEELKVRKTELTLHIGAGTFVPVRSGDIMKHDMHTERFTVTKEALELIREYHGRIIAVGTTSVRTLESIYWLGSQIINGEMEVPDRFFIDQWEPYSEKAIQPADKALEALIDLMNKRNIFTVEATTKMIIVPGYKFMLPNGIITNFHQPVSTLLLLIAAWAGAKWKEIYNYAIENNFRFLSYGDASLLFR